MYEYKFTRRQITQKKLELQSNHDLPYASRTLYHQATGTHAVSEVAILGYYVRTVSPSNLNDISVSWMQ